MPSKKPTRTIIYIVGPSSTGKSTLCDALAKRLDLRGGAYITEVARSVMRSCNYTKSDIGKIEMQREIMEAHMLKEQEGMDQLIQVCDRSAIDPIVYAMLTAADANDAECRRNVLMATRSFQKNLEKYRRSTFILLKPVPEWLVDDGVRSLEGQETSMILFRQVLRDLGIEFREVGRDVYSLAERVTLVMGIAKL